jgi:hypothetical protein
VTEFLRGRALGRVWTWMLRLGLVGILFTTELIGRIDEAAWDYVAMMIHESHCRYIQVGHEERLSIYTHHD